MILRMTSSHYNHEEQVPSLSVRRLHNYVYCPRLFYLQWVENIFVENEDTVAGSALHHRVDKPSQMKETTLPESGERLRSVAVASESLGLTGVVDLLEKTEEGSRCLIDYKKGSPARSESGDWQVKENDAIQLAAYALMLQEQGVSVKYAAVYYAEIRKRVYVDLTESLFNDVRRYLAEAKRVAESQECPPPVCDSRCLYCSAYPVCLPFESKIWAAPATQEPQLPPRPPMPTSDAGEILVVQTKDAYVGVNGGNIEVRLNGETVSKHPIHQLSSVSLYGAIQISAQAQQLLLEASVPISWFSPVGRFIGITHGLSSSGVDARLGQCMLWHSPDMRLSIAKEIIRAKIHNQRVMLMRNGQASAQALKNMAQLRDSCAIQSTLASLRGIEGAAAALYFENFAGMLKPGIEFDFNGRNRRPPKDPVNALLSFAYSLLVKELTGIAYGVGLDPFLGVFHSPRYGRPALALDMMEEFRPLIADSAVLTLINKGEISVHDFSSTSRGVILSDAARRQFWRAWTRRMDTLITHPTFA